MCSRSCVRASAPAFLFPKALARLPLGVQTKHGEALVLRPRHLHEMRFIQPAYLLAVRPPQLDCCLAPASARNCLHTTLEAGVLQAVEAAKEELAAAECALQQRRDHVLAAGAVTSEAERLELAKAAAAVRSRRKTLAALKLQVCSPLLHACSIVQFRRAAWCATAP